MLFPSYFKALSRVSRVLLASAVFTGCIRSLPPPKIRHSVISPARSYDQVCAHGDTRVTLRSHSEPPMSVIVECSSDRAAIVCLNSFHVRVRTITISRTGETRDELSFLASHTDSVETLLSEIGAVLAEPTREDSAFIIHVRERRVESAGSSPLPLSPLPAPRTGRN
jgi:hypothetical protein